MADELKINLNLEEMEKAGVHFGHRISRLHPKMEPFVAGVKNTVHVFDLQKSAKEFEGALKLIAGLAAEGKVILFVGTKPQARDLVKNAAVACKMPYVAERWLGGTLTNFETLSKRIQYFKDLERKKLSGELEKYTKKERLNFDKELEGLKNKFEGIKEMVKLPDAVLIMDIRKDDTCVREARRKKIPSIGITDTNVDPTLVDYPIPANDDAISSIKYILDKIQEIILASQLNAA